MKQIPKWLKFNKEGMAIIPKDRIECSSEFENGVELREDKIVFGSKQWNVYMENAEFFEVSFRLHLETGKITHIIIKPKRIGYIA